MADERKGLKILRLGIENVKRIKVVDLTPTEDIVQITGRNGQGKTSVLDAILYALGGVDTLPAMPIRKGEQQASIAIDLGEYVVRRWWTPEKGTVLSVTGPGGVRDQQPQTTINGFMQKFTLDPLRFLSMRADEQAKVLRGMVELSVDPVALDRANKADYDERRDVKRDHAALLARFRGLETIPATVPEQAADVSAIASELEKAGEHNGNIETIKLQKGLHERRAKGFEEETYELQGKIEAALLSIAKWREEVKAAEKHAADEEAKARGIVIPKPIDTAALAQKIKDAELDNTWIKRRAERRAIEAQLEQMAQLIRAFDGKIEARDEQKRQAMKEAKMPVDGLAFTADGVTYEGFPFEQISGAEQLRISMAVAMSGNPRLRVLRIVDGSLLDKASLELVKEEARKRDFQVWIEGVDESGEVGFVMEDGELASTPQSRDAAAKSPRPARKGAK